MAPFSNQKLDRKNNLHVCHSVALGGFLWALQVEQSWDSLPVPQYGRFFLSVIAIGRFAHCKIGSRQSLTCMWRELLCRASKNRPRQRPETLPHFLSTIFQEFFYQPKCFCLIFNPLDFFISPKPSHLALGVEPGVLLYLFNCVFQGFF